MYNKFLKTVPMIWYNMNTLYDDDNELNIKEEPNNKKMQTIVNQFHAMHKRIRDAVDRLHELWCIIMEKKTEVISEIVSEVVWSCPHLL